ncbi:MAG: iron ABC transporter permease [Candidatus Omnitrophica bacterium]|nr:iron ABC transporter permease [Candidatus Omnitrophota bacterium]
MRRWLGGLLVAALIVIAILPVAQTIVQALVGQDHVLEEFCRAVATPRVLGLFTHSLLIGVGVSLCCLAIGVPVGFLICRTDMYLRRAAQYAALLPLAIPPYIAAIAWIKVLAPQIYGPAGVVGVLSLSYLPFVSLLTVAGLTSFDRSLEEQAELAVGPWKAIGAITLPLIAPFVFAGALFVFVFSVSNYGVPALLRVPTYPIEIFTHYSAFYDHRVASLMALPLLLVTAAAVGLSYAMMRNRRYVSVSGTGQGGGRILPLGRYRGAGSAFAWLVIAVSGLIPLGVLVMASGSALAYWVALKASWAAIVRSLGISAVSAAGCLGLGFGLALLIERARWQGQRLLDVATVLPLAVPATVLGIGLIELWNRPGTSWVYAGMPILVIGMMARFLPFSVRILASSFKQTDRHLEEAAALTGAGGPAIARRILLPLMSPGIVASASICFIFSMAEIDTTLLVMPAGSETLASKIYTLMHYDVGPFTVALCVMLIALSMIPVGILGCLAATGRSR